MPNITHTISATVELKEAVAAITTIEGLNNWWTSTTTGNPLKGGNIDFRFGDDGLNMSVEKVTEDEVVWKCVAGPDEWIGTTIEFRFQKDEDGKTALFFTHRGWADETPFHYHCSMKWAAFMLSLKEYWELGEGRPFPKDIKITDPIQRKAA